MIGVRVRRQYSSTLKVIWMFSNARSGCCTNSWTFAWAARWTTRSTAGYRCRQSRGGRRVATREILQEVRESISPGVGPLVDADDLIASFDQTEGEVGPNLSARASDEHAHG